jgi:acetate kinase
VAEEGPAVIADGRRPARVCAGGVLLDPARNDASADIVSADASACTMRVVRTDEEAIIARDTAALLKGPHGTTVTTT